jgi:hypothetical protein
MSEDLEPVLRRVAAGEITPEQALALLGGPASAEPGSPHSTALPPEPEPGAPRPSPAQAGFGTERANDEPVTTIRLKTSYRSIHLLADPAVAQVHVVGDHAIRHDGPALVIETAGPLADEQAGPDDARGSGRFSFSLPRTIAWAKNWREHQLTIRVNPALLIELDVTGVDIKATGLKTGLRARLVASSLRGDKLHGPLQVDALTSSVKLTAVPTGESRIFCESSSMRLTLATGSDLILSTTNRMSRLALPERPVSTLPFEGQSTELTLGSGRDRLTLEAVTSSVTVQTQAWGEVPA